ncbi:hypothetical protein IAF81_04625 [Streptococcus thermophilus]|nr:hypothetical protein [Streptococcus thermophilus]MBO1150221.1 hypothetical protein [Streptococcus thermophilus]MBO1151840.1 hypothetical protein [Streptococcus thermophilus]MBO1153450.1 hypothetical protein [Streptococcus thermophilus]MBO1155072.1 hypothetical protein [Streptococcus thermophilus]
MNIFQIFNLTAPIIEQTDEENKKRTKQKSLGSLSTIVGDEKLTSREDRIGPLFMYVQCDEDTLLKVDKVSKTEAQTFDVFDQLISRFKFRV